MIEVKSVSNSFYDINMIGASMLPVEIHIPVESKALRSFEDYNAAVIATYEEYARNSKDICKANTFEILTRVAEHMYGVAQTDEPCISTNT